MPRPLIIKVQDHKTQSHKKVTGSIDMQLLKETNRTSWYGSYNQDIDYVLPTDNDPTNSMEESGSGSIVRSLISRYESSVTKPTLMKHKSKSLSDLVRPQLSFPKKTSQDDLLNDRYSSGDSGHQVFDFRKVLSKFETSNQPVSKANVKPVHKIKEYKRADISNQLQDLNDIKGRAKELLVSTQEFYYNSSGLSLWQEEVVAFLQQLSNIPDDAGYKKNVRELNADNVNNAMQNVYEGNSREESAFKRAKSLDSSEFSRSLKVKEIKSIFEDKVGDNKPLLRSISSTYFTGKPTGDSINFLEQDYNRNNAFPVRNNINNNSESEESEDSDKQGSYNFQEHVTEDKRLATQPVLVSTKKIQELRNIFESDAVDNRYVPYEDFVTQNADYNVQDGAFSNTTLFQSKNSDGEERMLPPPKVVILDENPDDGDDVENSKQQIEELIKHIEDYEDKIENLSEGDQEEGSYINEVLIRILVKLDDVKTYGDVIIQKQRREAIQYVQSCIKKLRSKIEK